MRFCVAFDDNFVTQFSSLEAFLIWSMSNGLFGGRLVTASASSLMRKAPTTIFEFGCRHFRLKFRIFFRSGTMQGGGLIANTRSSNTFCGTSFELKYEGRNLILCGRPDDGKGDGIESLPPSLVAENKIKIKIKLNV